MKYRIELQKIANALSQDLTLSFVLTILTAATIKTGFFIARDTLSEFSI